jgi:tetratricopeptide (TPR) repeat protein
MSIVHHTAFLSLFVVLATGTSARAALDTELKKPYQLEVALHIADNRALTPLFQEELARALGDRLRQTFGDLAQIKVVRTHSLLGEVAARGLEQALDGWEPASDVQTHFVLLDYTEGLYRLQARAHDGMTGQAAAMVRRIETGDRAVVPLLAAKLVEEGFGLVGTVTMAGKDVQLTLKGGGLGVPLDRWVKAGDVFAVSRVAPQGPKTRAVRVEWALLEVLDGPRDGVCRCRYEHRFKEDELRESPGTLGYRALKLATAQAPVRLRFLDDETLRPLDGKQVQVYRPGGKDKGELATTNRDGLAITRAAYGHLVIAHLPADGVFLPVEVIEGRTVVCRIKVKGGSESLAALDYRRDAWLRRVYDNVRLASDRAKELNKLLGKSLQDAQEAARDGLKNVEDELSRLTEEHGELKRLGKENNLAAKQFDLREGELRLAELREKHKKLKDFVERIDEVLKQGAQNVGLNRMLEQARLLEAEAEFAQAISKYEKVLEASPDQSKVRGHLDQLKRAWALQGLKHAEARTFVYETWPRLDAAALKKNLDAARQAFATLKAADDRLTPQKMLQANTVHAAHLKKELDRLRQKDTDDNRNQAKVIAQVALGMVQLTEEITAFVGTRKE